MRRVTKLVLTATGVSCAIGAAAAWRELDAHTRKLLRRDARRRMGRLRGKARRAAYELRGGHPDEHVPDAVLADRIRSRLGPLEKALDLPHVHVMAVNHSILLHGCVGSEADVAALEEAALAVPGVLGVTSYLHVGLGRGDERPSEGRRHQVGPSNALRKLGWAAALAGGWSARGDVPAWAETSVGAVLTVLAALLPPGERDHLLGHLPPDVRAFVMPSRRRTIRRAESFVAAAAALDAMPNGREEDIVLAVLSVLRELVPEEAHDVSAVLPAEIAELWWSAAEPTLRKEDV
jgi:uncharacterized protein (DUF2267 family)